MSRRAGKLQVSTLVSYALGVILVAGFVVLYWTRFTNTPGDAADDPSDLP